VSEKWKLSCFTLNVSELTELSSQSCILFPSYMYLCINGVFYGIVGQLVLIAVLNILVADCEDEEFACWRLGRPCEELVQARDTTP